MTTAVGTGKAAARSAGPLVPEDLVDLARYPLADPSAAEALVAEGQESLEHDGAFVLEGFLKPAAVARALRELEGLWDAAYYPVQRHNVYLAAGDPAFPPDHPRNRLFESDKGGLADDQVPAGSVLKTIYHWDRLQAFIAAVLGVPRLYPYADPLASLTVNIFHPGQQLAWHFDNADWAFTLLLQSAAAGGVYEYAPWIRAPGEENYEAVAAVLDGRSGGRECVRRLDMAAGALVLFRGRHSLHRVTPVEGDRPRIVAVLSYDPEPGVALSEHTRRLFYGRVA